LKAVLKMSLHSSFAPLVILLTLTAFARDAGATPKFLENWRNYWEYCTQLLRPSPRPAETTNIYALSDLKIRHNQQALARGRAIVASQPNIPIRYGPDRAASGPWLEWLDEITKKSTDLILDENLPFWRTDGDWYFQTAEPIQLYAPETAGLIQFPADSFILMRNNFAIGRIFVRGYPPLELYD
jgi:hypothetical protein